MKPSILLIEDDRDMSELVGGHLEHSGFDVQRADDGIKGQALALQYTPDLILLDLMLPNVMDSRSANDYAETKGQPPFRS